MFDEIESPPFPAQGVSVVGLHQDLERLRAWVLSTRDALHARLGREILPAPNPPPQAASAIYGTLSVFLHWTHLITLRRIREAWDQLLREYEDAWDCSRALEGRNVLLGLATQLLDDAYLSREALEARQESIVQKMLSHFTLNEAEIRRALEARHDQASDSFDSRDS